MYCRASAREEKSIRICIHIRNIERFKVLLRKGKEHA